VFEKYIYDARIAEALGCANKAFIVEYMIWSVQSKEHSKFEHAVKDGKQYMWDTYDDWQKRMPWLALRTIRTYLMQLRDIGLVEADQLSSNPKDRTTYYRVNMEKYCSLRGSIVTGHVAESARHNVTGHVAESARLNVAGHVAKSATCMWQNLPHVPITNTLTNTHKKNSPHKKCIPSDLHLAKRWLDFVRIKTPKGKFNEMKFAESIMRMRTRFSLAPEAIEKMFKWIQDDKFWSGLSPSPSGLLRKSPSDPDITKLEQVMKQMASGPKSKSERVMESILKTEVDIEPDYDPLRLTQ